MSSLRAIHAAELIASAILRHAPVMSKHIDGAEISFDNIEHWHQVTCRSHSLTNCRFDVQAPFRATLRSQKLGELTTGETFTGSFASIHSRRGLTEARKDGVDDFMALQIVQGDVHFAQSERSVTGRSGDVFVYDQSKPFALDLIGKHHLAFLVIPRAAMIERLEEAEHLTARALRSDAKVGELARFVMRLLLNMEGLNGTTAERVGRAALDILAAALDPSSSSEQTGHHRLLATAKAYMLKHLAENELDVDTIADALGVAPRTVNRIFAAEGVTPMRWLWQQRLTAAHDHLSYRRFGTVTEIALQCGFVDLSHFSRLFKKAYGISPSAILR